MTSNGADVVICGGGVIGAAIAYYLGKRGVAAVIVEADGVASGASGAAAGLLSLPNLQQSRGSMAELIRTSFDMHATLAETLPGSLVWSTNTLLRRASRWPKPKGRWWGCVGKRT